MSKEQAPARLLSEEQVESLFAQFRYMLIHEVKNMKLDVIETLGGMLARRSGLDRELHELGQRIEFLSKENDALLIRIGNIEKAGGIQPPAPGHGPVSSRALVAYREPAKTPPPRAPDPPSRRAATRLKKDGTPDRRGRPPGTGRYEAYNAAKRAKKAGGPA